MRIDFSLSLFSFFFLSFFRLFLLFLTTEPAKSGDERTFLLTLRCIRHVDGARAPYNCRHDASCLPNETSVSQ
jgi:hypothetical protein